jgi:hypothetical protein
MRGENFVSDDKINERFKELGLSTFMVKAKIGLAMVEVIHRAKRLVRVEQRIRHGDAALNTIFREIASLAAALEDLKKAEGR